MTAATTQKHYKVLLILDPRGREESIDQLIEQIKGEIISTGAEVTAADNLGLRDFARVTDARLTAANYVEFDVAAPLGLATRLQEHFRLNKAVYRLFVQSA
jgi:small subunit ribosomal protein S6